MAQVSKPAVSPTYQPAARLFPDDQRVWNPRYSRLGSLRKSWLRWRYSSMVKHSGHSVSLRRGLTFTR